MGAERFDQFQKGTDAKKAFSDAVDRAAWEYGHGGYTGTIAEKPGFEMRRKDPLTLSEAYVFADEDMDKNWYEHDKWGDAWAVPVKADDSPTLIGFLFYGIASS